MLDLAATLRQDGAERCPKALWMQVEAILTGLGDQIGQGGDPILSAWMMYDSYARGLADRPSAYREKLPRMRIVAMIALRDALAASSGLLKERHTCLAPIIDDILDTGHLKVSRDDLAALRDFYPKGGCGTRIGTGWFALLLSQDPCRVLRRRRMMSLSRGTSFKEEMLSPAPFNCLMAGYGKEGNLEAAEGVLMRMRNCSVSPNLESYNTLTKVYAQADKMSMAVKTMSQMRGQKISPDVITYTSVIGGFAATGKMKLEWLENMQQTSVSPNQVTFSTILRSCEKDHSVALAGHFLKKMQEMDVEPNRAIFNTLLNLYASARQLALAEGIFKEMVRKAEMPDLLAFGALVKAAARIPDMQRSLLWMERARNAALSPDARMFYSLLSSCAQVGDLPAIHQVLGNMKAQGLPEDVVTCAAVVRACGNAHDLKEAEKTLERLETIKPNEYTVNAMMTACASTKFPTKAEYWFSRLARKGAHIEVVGFNSLMANWKEDSMRMQHWLMRMRSVDVSPDVITFNGLLNSAAIVCDAGFAKRLWSDMEEIGKPTLGSYRAFAKALAREGHVQELAALLGRMEKSKFSSDVFCMRALLTACAAAKSKEAAQMAEELFRQHRATFAKDSYARQALRLATGNKYAKLAKEFKLEIKSEQDTTGPGLFLQDEKQSRSTVDFVLQNRTQHVSRGQAEETRRQMRSQKVRFETVQKSTGPTEPSEAPQLRQAAAEALKPTVVMSTVHLASNIFTR
eukprot:g26306.t1